MFQILLLAFPYNYYIFFKAIDKDGDGMYNVVNSRDGKIWTAKPVKEAKDTSWRAVIASQVLEVGQYVSVSTNCVSVSGGQYYVISAVLLFWDV
jgi:hypothetical protein